CAANPDALRDGIYLTSITKCFTANQAAIPTMAKNCRSFLNDQLAVIQPRLVIALGAPAFDELWFTDQPPKDPWCQLFHSRDYLLVTPWGSHFDLLVWPHPSPSNRWLNSDVNKTRLQDSFAL